MKKIFAWCFLILIFCASPLLFALWWIFPILAGLSVWLLLKSKKIKSKKWKWVHRFLKPALLFLLFIFAIWLVWIYRRHATPSYESTSAAFLLKKIVPPTKEKSAQLEQVEIERRGLMDAIARQKIKIADIGSVLNLYNTADQVLVSRNSSGKPDEFGIGSSMSVLHNELAAHKLPNGTDSPNFLQPKNLQTQMEQAIQVLNKVRSEATTETDAANILEKKNLLLEMLAPYRVDDLYTKLSDLQTAIRRTLKVELKADLTRIFAYDSSDALTVEQSTVINLGGQKAVRLESAGLFPVVANDSQLIQQVSYSEDSDQAQELKSDAVVPLHSEAKQITITQRVIQPSASYRLVTDRIPVAFRAIDLRWDLPLSSWVVLHLRLPEGETWRFTVPIETAESDSIQSVSLPRHAFFYSDGGLQPPEEGDANVDLLVPSSVTPRVMELAAEKSIRVELLPQYLHLQVAQKYKQYFILENTWTALLICIISAIGAAIVSPPKEPGGN